MRNVIKTGLVICIALLATGLTTGQEIDKQEAYLVKLLKKFKGTKKSVIKKELFTYDEVKEIIGDKVDDITEEKYLEEINRHLDRLVESSSELTIDWSDISVVEYKTRPMNDDGLDLVSGKMRFKSGDSEYKIKAMFVKYKGKYRLGELRSLYQYAEEPEYYEEPNEATEEAVAEEVEMAYLPEISLTDTSFCDIVIGMHLNSPDVVTSLKSKFIDGVRKVSGKYIDVKIILDDHNRHIADVKLDQDGFVEEIRVYSKDVYFNKFQSLQYLRPANFEYSYPEGEYITEGNSEYFKAGNIYFKLGFNMENEPNEIIEVLIRRK